jgi:hypothetical protein
MKIVVIGGSGLVGRNVVGRLGAQGHATRTDVGGDERPPSRGHGALTAPARSATQRGAGPPGFPQRRVAPTSDWAPSRALLSRQSKQQGCAPSFARKPRTSPAIAFTSPRPHKPAIASGTERSARRVGPLGPAMADVNRGRAAAATKAAALARCRCTIPAPGAFALRGGPRRWFVHDRQEMMVDERLVLRFSSLDGSDARELAGAVGAETTILPDDSAPIGGYGDLGTRTVAVIVTARTLRAVARYLAARQHSHDERVSLIVQIDDPDGTRRDETLTYKARPGQPTVEAAATALRALPGVEEALKRSVW